jgi:hypothetical protein
MLFCRRCRLLRELEVTCKLNFIWGKMTSRGKITRELLSFTYGALVVKLIKDLEQPEDVNT